MQMRMEWVVMVGRASRMMSIRRANGRGILGHVLILWFVGDLDTVKVFGGIFTFSFLHIVTYSR